MKCNHSSWPWHEQKTLWDQFPKSLLFGACAIQWQLTRVSEVLSHIIIWLLCANFVCKKRDPSKFDPLAQELNMLHLTIYLFIILLLLYNLQIYSFFYSYDELECNGSLIKIGCRKSCLIIIRIDTYRWWEFWFCIFFLFCLCVKVLIFLLVTVGYCEI